MELFISELIGTWMMILIGDSVVANVCLDKSAMKGAGTLQITITWGFAVLLPACIFGKLSGAHFNPALTLALAVEGSTPWSLVPQYITGQMLGAILGAVCVYILFAKHFEVTKDADVKLGIFCTSPSIPCTPLNLLSEIIGTFVLVFAIKGVGHVSDIPSGINTILVSVIVMTVGMSLGGLTGYAINPARDLGPRIAHAILPIPGKRDSNWHYAWIPVLGPILGALLAVGVYHMIPW